MVQRKLCRRNGIVEKKLLFPTVYDVPLGKSDGVHGQTMWPDRKEEGRVIVIDTKLILALCVSAETMETSPPEFTILI